jgi:hypothetical protein
LPDTSSFVGLGGLQCFVEVDGSVDFPRFAEVFELVGLPYSVEAAKHSHLELVEQYLFLKPPQKMLEGILD